MLVIDTPAAMQQHAVMLRRSARTIGFVPTMGALHDGHLSLIRRARSLCDVVVVSIFVNPTQFGPHEDLARYPRPFAQDRTAAEEAGADILFHPTPEAMYPAGTGVTIDPGRLATVFEGGIRPDHFRGVATVVTKLFNIVQPDVAVFGQKDAQQTVIIRRLVQDLNIPVRIVVAPIVREPDGLAMSSRNVYLSQSERTAASAISGSLFEALARYRAGERDPRRIEAEIARRINATGLLQLEYAAVVDAGTLLMRTQLDAGDDSLVLVAVRAGTTRLIDNIILHDSDSPA